MQTKKNFDADIFNSDVLNMQIEFKNIHYKKIKKIIQDWIGIKNNLFHVENEQNVGENLARLNTLKRI